MDDTNRFLRLLLTAHNNDEEYDLQELAKEAGIPYETAQELSTVLQESLAKHGIDK